jgi:hypothetical protein
MSEQENRGARTLKAGKEEQRNLGRQALVV